MKKLLFFMAALIMGLPLEAKKVTVANNSTGDINLTVSLIADDGSETQIFTGTLNEPGLGENPDAEFNIPDNQVNLRLVGLDLSGGEGEPTPQLFSVVKAVAGNNDVYLWINEDYSIDDIPTGQEATTEVEMTIPGQSATVAAEIIQGTL